MSCASAFSGCVVVVVNLIFMIIGIAVSALGGILKWAPHIFTDKLKTVLVNFANTVTNNSQNVGDDISKVLDDIFRFLGEYGIALFVVGLCLVVISLLAVCGVCCKSKWLLGTYAFILGLITAGIIAFTVVLFVKKDWVQNLGKEQLTKFVADNYVGPAYANGSISFTGISGVIDILQAQFKCCGVSNYEDFNQATKWNRTVSIQTPVGQMYTNLTVPLSCCVLQSNNNPKQDCIMGANSTNSYMDKGCYSELWKTIGDNWKYVQYAHVGLSAFMVLLFIFAICAMRFEKEKIDPI